MIIVECWIQDIIKFQSLTLWKAAPYIKLMQSMNLETIISCMNLFCMENSKISGGFKHPITTKKMTTLKQSFYKSYQFCKENSAN